MKTPLDVDERVGEIADPFSQKREELRRTQKQAEAEAANAANSGLGKKSPGSTSLQNLEQSANPISSRNSHSLQTKNPANSPFGYLDKFTKIKLKGASSLITVVLAVFMGGGFLTILFSPSLAIIQMKEVLTHALNDQLHATDTRSKSIFRATMKGPANCGTVKICKRFTTMSTTQVHEFEKHKNIKIERDMIDEKNGRVRKILFTNQLGEKISISNSSELQSALKNNVEFKAAWTKGFNPQFKTLSDSLMLKVLYKLKATKNQDISGKNDEERRKKLNQIGGGVERTNARAIIEGKDEDGKKTYTDENGNKLDPKDVEAAKAMEGRVEGYMKSGGAGGVLKKAAINGVSVTGTADTACSLYNGIRHVSALAKNVKKAQMARYALALVLTPADRIKAGAASEADTTFVGNTLMATSPPSKALDESKLSQKATKKPPTITSTAIGNAFDSKGFKLASGESVGKITSNDARFSLAGVGSTVMLDTITRNIARVINGGNPDPKALSKKCGYIQSWFVRGGALAVGIVTGVASLGLSTLVIGGASFALQLATPLIESTLADIIAGNVVKDISGYDSGNAVYAGSAGMFGDIAENRGMAPVTKDEGADYLAANRQTLSEYDSMYRYVARSTPFDISNHYSFMGSIVAGLIPVAQQSRTSAAMAAIHIASILPRSFSTIIQPNAGALSSNYFGKCSDPTYQSLGIDAGPFCEVRHQMSATELAIDPAQNALWMANTGNIDPESEDGAAKDNKQEWNYVKFLDECAHRTAGWGEPQDTEGGGDGSNCLDPKYKELNEHFRVYTMDQSLKLAMDETNEDQQNTPGTTGFADGQSGTVGSSGWAFPTTPDSDITFGFQPGHEGVSITGKNSTEAINQPIFSAYDGKVVAAGPSREYGNWIVVEHAVNNRKVSTVYTYMNTDGVLVRVGDSVKAGQEIGRIGNQGSGNRAYLYFELWQGSPLTGGTRVDPTDILEKAKDESHV